MESVYPWKGMKVTESQLTLILLKNELWMGPICTLQEQCLSLSSSAIGTRCLQCIHQSVYHKVDCLLHHTSIINSCTSLEWIPWYSGTAMTTPTLWVNQLIGLIQYFYWSISHIYMYEMNHTVLLKTCVANVIVLVKIIHNLVLFWL